MSMNEADSANEGEERLVLGQDWSRLLVDRAAEELRELYEEEPTALDIARHLGSISVKVESVLEGGSTFGRDVFERLAQEKGQPLAIFQRELMKWKMDREQDLE